jgi:tRNA G18 (ribose-2'-O)-methylase SpoU
MLTADDPRLLPYIYTGTAKRLEPADVFIAEGEKIVRRLWASSFECRSVMVAANKLDRIAADVPAGVELLVVSEETMHAVLGFKFHSGIMATGVRRPWPTATEWLADLAARSANAAQSSGVHRAQVLLVLPEITDPLNLGAILRNAAAFGVAGVLLGPNCRDPLTRQAIRTSMGTIFKLPLCRSNDLLADLAVLKEAGFESWATVLDENADVLGQVKTPARLAVLMGNEGPGLSSEIAAAADRKVIIPMHNGTDSLNVAAASAVFLFATSQSSQ